MRKTKVKALRKELAKIMGPAYAIAGIPKNIWKNFKKSKKLEVSPRGRGTMDDPVLSAGVKDE